MKVCSLGSIFSVFLFDYSAAQSQVTLDGTLGPVQTLVGPDFQVTAELGHQVGGNLFHSFESFSLATGETAQFMGPSSVERIIGRVTGKHASIINGKLSSSVPAADLYLINPMGVSFGPTAIVDIEGSLHISTADRLRMKDGAYFNASYPNDSQLSSAVPETFGFLNNNPGQITIQQSSLVVSEGQAISLIAGDIEAYGLPESNYESLEAPGGEINLVSVASTNEVIFENENNQLSIALNHSEALGEIKLVNSSLQAGGDGGGTIMIRGGRLITDGSFIQASAKGPIDGTLVSNPGLGIDIELTKDLQLVNDSAIETNVFEGVAHHSGGIRIRAHNIDIDEGSFINSNVGGIGRSGDIDIEAKELTIHNQSLINARTAGSGDAGDIYIQANKVSLYGGGFIFSQAARNSGSGGDIFINTDQLSLLNEHDPSGLNGIASRSELMSTGDAGNMKITTRELNLSGGRTFISAPTFGQGRGGNIDIEISDKAWLYGSELWPFDTGIFATTFGIGKAGNISISANRIQASHYADILTSTFNRGDAGDLTVEVNHLQLSDGSNISSSSFGDATGNAGDLNLIAKNIFISGVENSLNPGGLNFTGLTTFTSAPGGDAGHLQIKAERLQLDKVSYISSQTQGPGQSGDIDIHVTKLDLLNGSAILANTLGAGHGGTVSIIADSVTLAGISPQPIMGAAGNRQRVPSSINTQTGFGGGEGGEIQVTATDLILDAGQISAETFGSGKGGNIELSSDHLHIKGRPGFSQSIQARSFCNLETCGEAGGISIQTETLIAEDTSISTQTVLASGGNIEIFSQEFVTLIDSNVTTSVGGGNKSAGNISITEPNVLTLLDNSHIEANTFGGVGGVVNISTDTLFQSPDSTITAEAESRLGIDGVVEVDAPDTNISAELVILPSEFFDPTTILARPCTEKTGVDVIHLITRSYQALPDSPYALRSHRSTHTTQDNSYRVSQGQTVTSSDTQTLWSIGCRNHG